MKLTILGSGTCVPTIKRGSPANYLKIGDKETLVDCGSGTLRQLVKARLDYKKIDMVFLTHLHIDHVLDLATLLQALNWTPGFKRTKDLTLVGPIGLKAFYELFQKPFEKALQPRGYKIIIKEIRSRITFKDFSVECAKTIHTDTSLALKFIENKKSLVISGDCDYDESLVTFSNRADVLLLECSFSNAEKHSGHLIPKECGLIAQESQAKKLILTHLYPISPREVRLSQAKNIFKNTLLAEDFMTINV
jgi:ribonuclease BN (tRNA processing enzyme)